MEPNEVQAVGLRRRHEPLPGTPIHGCMPGEGKNEILHRSTHEDFPAIHGKLIVLAAKLAQAERHPILAGRFLAGLRHVE